ncbi:MAG: chemotaxis protein CheW [Desulfobacteraceae bacterium]|jgi:purine-binding chemotaxis protein CheW
MNQTEILESNQYLTFKLDQEVFSLAITQVREVLDFTEVTKVPRMPEFMRGVINLRGGVVPVVDLRLKFGLTATDRSVDTCVIIMEIDIEGETTLIGALADSVQEVMTIEPENIEPPPRIGTRLNTEFIKGMGKKSDDFIIILDIDKVFSSDELEGLQTADKHHPLAEGSAPASIEYLSEEMSV